VMVPTAAKLLLLVCLLVTVAVGAGEEAYCRRGCLGDTDAAVAAAVEGLFQEWCDAYGREYGNEELRGSAMSAFEENLRFVRTHNSAAQSRVIKGGRVPSYTVALNQFADLREEEFEKTLLQNSIRPHRPSQGVHDNIVYDPASLPATWDWRKLGVVSPVLDQEGCNSCWAFVATSAVESAKAIKDLTLLPADSPAPANYSVGSSANATVYEYGGKRYLSSPPVLLSQQNLMDCSYRQGNLACLGGSMDGAYEYIFKNGGIDTAESYPYRAISSTECRYNATNRAAVLMGYANLEAGSEDKLQAAVAHHSPVSVCVDGRSSGFQFYEEGIYYNEYCSQWNLDHGLLVVGYGSLASANSTSTVQDYWVCKNSYGTGWGSDGYILMARNMDNNCGIASHGTYPLM